MNNTTSKVIWPDKVIFLDIDGVLNGQDNLNMLHMSKHRANMDVQSRDEFGQLFDERCVGWLRYICQMSDVGAICLISSWAILDDCKTMWLKRNMPGYLLPSIYTEGFYDRFAAVPALVDKHNIKQYVILDDSTFENDKHFVQVIGKFGLIRENALDAIRILSGNIE